VIQSVLYTSTASYLERLDKSCLRQSGRLRHPSKRRLIPDSPTHSEALLRSKRLTKIYASLRSFKSCSLLKSASLLISSPLSTNLDIQKKKHFIIEVLLSL